jgi:uncharacterized protein YjbI with pentapeptide repeats
MANKDHLERLTSRFSDWNEWRAKHPDIVPDLFRADLEGKLLIGMNLSGANMDRANLNRADLRRADLTRASIRNASIYDAHFNEANLQQADLCGSVIIRCSFLEAQMRGVKLRAEIQKGDFQKALFPSTDLSEVRFRDCDFAGANLTDAKLSGARIIGSSLSYSDLSRATMDRIDLTGSRLNRTKLRGCSIHGGKFVNTSLIQTDFSGADITGCQVYGTSVWDIATNETTEQTGLIIQGPNNPKVVVDDIEVAQFIYLLLRREKIRNVIDTITSKAVLILGRFTPERKVVLDALSEEVRRHQLLPIVFDFEASSERDFTETIKILAGMSLFVIADVTNPKSAPMELQATVPDYKIPFVTIIQEGERPFALLDSLKLYSWVLERPLAYRSIDKLREGFKPAILDWAWKKHYELQKARMKEMEVQSIEDFL